jgi:hypothetical protein
LEDSSQGQVRSFQILVCSKSRKYTTTEALVDTGATMSFINEKYYKILLARQPNIELKKSRSFNIETANGTKTIQGLYINLWIRQNHNNYYWQNIKLFINKDFELANANLILGIADLRVLGIFIASVYNDKLIFKNKGVIHISDTIKELQDHGQVGYDVMDRKIQYHANDKVADEIDAISNDIQIRKGNMIAKKTKQILLEYYKCLAKSKYDIGTIPGIKFKIELRDNVKPIRQQPIRINDKQLNDELYSNIQELLKAGVLAEVQQSDWQTPVFIVINHDKTTRMVTNYKKLNAASKDEAYPVTSVPEMMRQFRGKTVFSKFDICKAFMNIEVEEETQKLLTIITPYGCYKYLKMPFGHKNCPATWSRAADLVFRECRDILYFVDDIVLGTQQDKQYSAIDNHFRGMQEFFSQLVKYNLKVKLSKCQFFVDEFTWLGKIVTKEGIKTNDEYIKKLLTYRHPTNLTEYRRWLGLLEWISNHIYYLKELMHPLRDLKKQNVRFKWQPKHERAFNQVRQIIQQTEVIQHPDFGKPFIVHVDASNNSYGGILMQTVEDFDSKLLDQSTTQFYIVDMFSRFWSSGEESLHITSKELLALINAINKWSNYISRNKFYISTDLNNIPHLLKLNEDKIKLNAQHHRWAMYLLGLNFEVRHIQGVENKVADFLSRLTKTDINQAYKSKGSVHMCYLDSTLFHISEAYTKHQNYETNVTNQFHTLLTTRYPKRATRNSRPRYAKGGTEVHPKYLSPPLDATLTTPLQKGEPVNIVDKYCKEHKEEEKEHKEEEQEHKEEEQEHKEEEQERKVERVNSPGIIKIPRQLEANYNKVRKEYQNKIIEQVENLQSDHQSSEDSFRADDLERNNTILQDPVLANQLLKTWKLDKSVFNKELIKINQEADPIIHVIRDALKSNGKSTELPQQLQIMLGNGMIRIGQDNVVEARLPTHNEWKIYAPSQHKLALLKYYHESTVSLHAGIVNTEKSIKKYFYWPNLNADVRQYVSHCQECRQAKNFIDSILYEPINWKPMEFNQTIAIDHKGPLPRTKSGNRYIMNIMDLFTGYVESIPLPRIGAATTAYNILTKWIYRHGVPEAILTDQGSDFASTIVATLCKQLNIDKKFSSAYTPQGNGQIERFHRTMSEALKLIMQERQISFNETNSPWDLYIAQIRAKHNNQTNRVVGLSPNELVYGRKIPLPSDRELVGFKSKKELPKGMKVWLNKTIGINRQIARQNLNKYYIQLQSRFQKQSQKHSQSYINYKLGDKVVIKEGNYSKMGSNNYNIQNYSGVYVIVKVYSNGRTFDLQNQLSTYFIIQR